jgi:tetratricopeptide (TPR) repeat protein
MVVPLEAVGGAEARKRQSEMTQARQLIGSMEKNAAVDADFSAGLTAWSGRLAILEGKASEARRLHRQAMANSPGNISSIILGIRLEGDPEKRLELIEKELVLSGQHSSRSGFGELNIEKARSLLELQRFAEAVGAFDTAFASELDSIYRESYQKERDRAWELRNFDGGSAGTLNILDKAVINWKDCISLIKNETRLLQFLTGGRNVSEEELFNRLLERSFIPYTQDINVRDWPAARPRIEEPVLRSGAAWLIWHLYAESRADRGLLSRYSARFATGANPRSPITDVPPLSPFFDSILGCVETEIMSLRDGRNFKGEEAIRGAELLSILKKIDSL